MGEAYDLIIIGGRSAGLTGAGFAAQLGSRVALVEGNRVGGDCRDWPSQIFESAVPHTLCLTSKRLPTRLA